VSISATPDQQRQLLSLQVIDSKIARLRRRAADLPQRREADATAEQLRAAAREMTEGIDQLERLRAAADDSAEVQAVLQQLEAGVAEARRRGEALAALQREQVAAVPRAAAALQEELVADTAERAALADQLEGSLLAAYETAQRRTPSPVVVPLLDRTCGGCMLTIPAMALDHARAAAASALPRCPECGRYLVIDPPEAAGISTPP
jgi:uncharacterized protein